MKTVVVATDLTDGRPVLATVTEDVILVAVDDRACLAHRRWFGVEQAERMIAALQKFVDTNDRTV